MKVMGIELEDAGHKPKVEEVKKESSVMEPNINYPSMRVNSEGGYNDLPINLEGFKAGDKVILIALVNIKEKTKRESESKKKNESSVSGELEFLKVGIKKTKSKAEEDDEDFDEAINKI